MHLEMGITKHFLKKFKNIFCNKPLKTIDSLRISGEKYKVSNIFQNDTNIITNKKQIYRYPVVGM